MMTGLELVRRAATFNGPERIPCDLPDEYGSDFVWVGMEPDPAYKPPLKGQDEWGCVWSDPSDLFPKGEVINKALASYDDLSSLVFPDLTTPGRYARAAERIAANRESKFVVANTRVNYLDRIKLLRGYEETYSDPLVNPEGFDELLRRLCKAQMTVVQIFADMGANGIFWCDDLGGQDRPIYSPAVFRKFFKPYYRKVYDYAHSRGMLTFLHSCGHILELFDDLKDAGLDVIQLDQQENMGLDNLAEKAGGKLCFWCPVDIQKTMVDGRPKDVSDYAHRMMLKLGSYNGGFMAKWFWTPKAIGHSPENVKAMSEAFVRYGRYPLK